MTWLIRPGHMRRSAVAHDKGAPKGWAVVECVINAKGRLADCTVIASNPRGGRIEKYVVAMAKEYLAAKVDAEGRPVAGRRVRYSEGITNYAIP